MKKVICFFAIVAWLSVDAQQDWELIHNTNTDIGIEYVWMSDTNHIWGMFQNDVYFSPDGGHSWDLQFEHEGNYYTDIQFLDSLTGYFVMWSYTYKTVDGGNVWDLVNHNIHGISYTTLFFLNSDTGWIAGDYRNVSVTNDGGESWIVQSLFNTNGSYTLRDIHFFDPLRGCAVGGDPTSDDPFIMTTSDGGEQWTEIFPDGDEVLVDVQFLSQDQVWCCNSGGDIFRSDDGGYSWQNVVSLGVYCLDDLHFFNDSSAIAISGCRSYTCSTTKAWNSWQEIQISGNNRVERASFCDENNGIAVGYGGNVLKTIDAGNTWKRLNDQFDNIGFFSPMNGWAIQSWMNKNFMHTTDGGVTWMEVETGHTGMLRIMDIISDQVGFAVTSKAELLKSEDAGGSWQIIDSDLDTTSFTDIQFIDETTGFMCAAPGAFYKTVNGGKNWISYPFDTINVITSLDFINALEGWIAGYQGFVGHTLDGGLTWESTKFPYYMCDIEFITEKKGFVLSTSAVGYETDDGGATWIPMEIDLLHLYNIDFIDTLHGWISGIGRLLYTADGGDSWNEVLDLQTNGDDQMINDLFALDSANAWACTAGGSVFSCSYFVGIEEDKSVSEIKIYPNPVNDQLNIDMNSIGAGDLSVRIFSIDGKLLLLKEFQRFKEEIITLDLTDYSPGIYFLNLKGTHNSSCFKVIKK